MGIKKEAKESDLAVLAIILFFSLLCFLKMAITFYSLEQSDKYDLFVDLLFVLSGVMMGLGVAIYTWIYKNINNYVKKEIAEGKSMSDKMTFQNRRLTEAQSFKNVGYMHFCLYKTYADCGKEVASNKDKAENLKQAIDFTYLAMSVAKDLEETENITLICIINNNLAWFIKEKWECIRDTRKEKNFEEFKQYLKKEDNVRKYNGDKDKAFDCINYIANKKNECSKKEREQLIETYNETKKTFLEIDNLTK